MEMRITLPDDLPPANMNVRSHWAVSARETRLWRETVGWMALAWRRERHVGRYGRVVHVVLHATPPDRRRRDRHNLTPCLKAAVDGLIDAGVIADDTPEHVVSDRVELHPADGVRAWRWLLEVRPA